MTRCTDHCWYWSYRGNCDCGMPRTRRQRQRAIKATRQGRRMRPPVKRKPELRYYHFDSVRMFLGGVEVYNGKGSFTYSNKPRPRVVNEYTVVLQHPYTLGRGE